MDKEAYRSIARDRIVYPDAVYHLTNRAPGREQLFLEENDYLRMLSLLKESSKKFQWNFFSFCLMPNHIHCLIRIKEPNLSEAAKNLFERYAKYFNTKYQRKGPVFCKPFRARLCLADSHLLAASLYIHLNPLKANLIKTLKGYKWSSLNLYRNKAMPATFIDYSFILNMLDENMSKAREIYLSLLDKSKEFEYKFIPQDVNALGKFRIEFLKLKDLLNDKRFKKEEDWLLWDEVEKYRQNKYSKSPESIKAKVHLIEQLFANGYKMFEVANFLGVSRKAIYNLLKLPKTSIA